MTVFFFPAQDKASLRTRRAATFLGRGRGSLAGDAGTLQVNKQVTSDSSPDDRKRVSLWCVVFSAVRRCICHLNSHRRMRGFPASGVPLKSSQRVCFCQALACFGDYIFVPLLSCSPPLLASKEFMLYLLTHTSVHARTHGAQLNIFTVSLFFFLLSFQRK